MPYQGSRESQKVSFIPGLADRKKSVAQNRQSFRKALQIGSGNIIGGRSDAATVTSDDTHRHTKDAIIGDDAHMFTDDSDSESDSESARTKKRKTKRRGAWIAEHFAMKDCIKYTPKPLATKKVCYCGRTKRQHRKDAQTAGDPDDDHDPQTILKDLIEEFPTDAYGEIQFGHQSEGINNKAKYVRISDNTDSAVIMELLMYYWNLPRPRLVLSITGGGRSFKLNKQDQDTFSRGIQKAAQTTDAWILTAGFNAGVPKIVGQTMKESQTLKWLSQGADAEDQDLNCIGIAPWGYVSGSDQLVGTNAKGCYPACYKLNNVIVKNRPVPLNSNHTHFLFIDNGLRNEPAYGGEIMMRAQIEGAIQAPTTAHGLGLPVVLLVLEGGPDTILNVRSSIAQGIPTVLCDGTGRAADILAYAYHHTKECEDGTRCVKEANIPFLEEKLGTTFGFEPGTDVMNKMIQNINFCVRNEELITVFEMDEGERSDLDLAILTALLKGQAATRFYQLALALSWNRVDVAHEYICTDEVNWPPGSLDNFLTQAIVANQVGFVELFLEQGIVMKDYLTVSKLRGLYNTCDVDQHLRQMLVKIRGGGLSDVIYLNDIRIVIAKLLGSMEDNLYAFDRRHTGNTEGTLSFALMSTTLTGVDLIQKSLQEYLRSERKKVVSSGIFSPLTVGDLANPGMPFSRPFSELFLWALLTDRIKLAEFFWQQTENPIFAAIMASCILLKMSKYMTEPHDGDEYTENARKFEDLAAGLLDKCYETDNTLAQMMLDVPNDHISNKNVLSLAAEAEDKGFISHGCCQTLLTNIWNRGIRSRGWKIIVSILCPFFILSHVRFCTADDGTELRPLKKLQVFYTAPVVRFWCGRISYFALVLLYSYVILANFSSGPTLVEQILTGWIVILIIEEVRQALLTGEDDDTIGQRVMNWMKSEWNILDGIFMICSLLGITLHYVQDIRVMRISLGFYAFSCFLLYTMALRISVISPYLGPLMVMIRKMIKEMFGFLFILLVFMLGYGVAAAALSHPYKDFTANTITSVIYQPYFTIYGELFLDEGDDSCGHQDPSCSETHRLLPFMLALYLLLGNVLLLNLLIAIFSSVFDEVQENSIEIWKFEMYTLVMESSDLPLLPPPFVIFEHIYYLHLWIIRKCQRKCYRRKLKVRPKYSKKQKRMLKLFEKECAAEFRKERVEQERDEIPERIKRLDKRLETLNKQQEMMTIEVTKQLQNINKQLSAGVINTTPDLLKSPRQIQAIVPPPIISEGQMSQGQTMTSKGQMQGQSSPQPIQDWVKGADTLSQASSVVSSNSSGSRGKKKKRRSKKSAKVEPEHVPFKLQESGKWANKQPGAPVQNYAPLQNTSNSPKTERNDLQSHMTENVTNMPPNCVLGNNQESPSSSNIHSNSNHGKISDEKLNKKISITADQFMHMHRNAVMQDSPTNTGRSDSKTENAPQTESHPDNKTENMTHVKSVSKHPKGEEVVNLPDIAPKSDEQMCNGTPKRPDSTTKDLPSVTMASSSDSDKTECQKDPDLEVAQTASDSSQTAPKNAESTANISTPLNIANSCHAEDSSLAADQASSADDVKVFVGSDKKSRRRPKKLQMTVEEYMMENSIVEM